jgi:hypothetical protein
MFIQLFLLGLLYSQGMEPMVIFQFSHNSSLDNWYIMDDVVMGGRSNGSMQLNEEGQGEFKGHVSLENNGGFSSVRFRMGNESANIEGYKVCKLKVRGDGKSYQFRTKRSPQQRYSYIYNFETTGEWETIDIPLHDMFPSFRGYRLDRPNYTADVLGEIAFLISNKKDENFKLQIESIVLE